MRAGPYNSPGKLLAVDIGNTNIVLGVFEGDELRADVRLHTDDRATGDELGLIVVDMLERRGIAREAITAVAVSNVVPGLSRSVEELARTSFGVAPMVVGPGVKTGVRILYDDPRQVGGDRIVNAVAAQRIYGGPAILVDFGTGTTIDAINERGDYLGGAIAPGIHVALDALVSRAARLVRVDLVAPPTAIGRNTQASLQAGMVYGYVGLVEGLVARMKAEMGTEAKVIATGGLADLFSSLSDVITHVDHTLTLVGLRLLHDLNTEVAAPPA